MDLLRQALDDASAGRGHLVMLVGEPGIGKTRTATELAAYARTRGFQVYWGWCYEEEGAPPYWLWIQAMHSCVHQQAADQLRSQMGPGAGDIAEVIPDLRSKLPDLEPPPSLEPEQARFRLFDSITTFLKNASLSGPLMLVLDDLHWADKPSLLLLQFLARYLSDNRLFILGCYRDVELSRQHPLAETLAQLSREPTFQRHLLQGLSPEDTGRFIETTAGVTPSQELLQTIYAQTEGNPFFMTEVVRLLYERDELITEAGAEPREIRIPQGVREVIGQRLNLLSEQCNQTLVTASIVGRVFELPLLSRLMGGLSDEQLLETLEGALAARVVVELSHGVGQYQFAHALIQEMLSAELSFLRRVRLHATIVETLEDMYGAKAEAHAAVLAYHFSEAATAADTDKLLHYSLVTGERALATYAHEEALNYFQRALAVKEGQPMDGETAFFLSTTKFSGPKRSPCLTHRCTCIGTALPPPRSAWTR